MSTPKRIAVSGAGVAGPALAFWLARAGWEPVLIEKAPRFRDGGYIIDFWGLGYDIVERMGLLPQVLEAGYQVAEVRLVGDRGRRVGGFSTEVFRRATDGRFTSLPRGDLARVLFDAVKDRVETLFDEEIAALTPQGNTVEVGFAHAPPREFDLVIGADGLHSKVRELTFGPEARYERPIGYHVAAFEAEGYRPRDPLVYVAHARPGREVFRFALRGDRTLVLFVFADERMDGPAPHGTAERKALLRSLYGNAGWECPALLDVMDRTEELYFDRVSQIAMGRWAKGRIGLVGDAAACVSLLAGEGTGLAITEAYVLAGELARAGNDPAAGLDAYEARMRPFIEAKQKAARGFAPAFAPRTAPGLILRNLVSRLLAVPGAPDLMLGASLKDDFDLPDYSSAR